MKSAGTLAQLLARVSVLEGELEILNGVVTALRDLDPPRTSKAEPHPAATAEPPPAAKKAEPVQLEFASLEQFVTEHFAPVYTRAQSPTLRWCPQWWDHAEAIYRLEALWRSWETCRRDPLVGIADWLRNYLDPQLAVLTSPTGPFMQCTADRHSPLKALPVLPAPEGHWNRVQDR